MIMSDIDLMKEIIIGDLGIDPYNESSVQPASIDLHLGNELKTVTGEIIDISKEPYYLKPLEFILGSTYESVSLPSYIAGKIEGRSSVARLGLMVHLTAGYVDPGFTGNITLELFNVSNKPFPLEHLSCICQFIGEALTNPCDSPYGSEGLNSKYQDSKGTVNSKWEEL